ncbi:hypothetical protein KJ840_02555 [Patescibacteria group bacterium]|nr:hypothetical protein [Patescibacteria group bacterium]
MKKKIQPFSRDLKMPRLYRDDLESIEKIIKDKLKPREYKLETKDFEYDELGTIPKNNTPITDFHIQTHSPYISIDFNRFSAQIYAGDDDLNTTGALFKINDILSKKERKVLFWSQKIAVWLAPILFIAPIQALTEIGEIKSVKHWVALGMAFIAAIWWIVSFHSSMHRFSVITLVSFEEKPGFIRRNKDQIIIGFVVGIPVAIVSFLFGLLLK